MHQHVTGTAPICLSAINLAIAADTTSNKENDSCIDKFSEMQVIKSKIYNTKPDKQQEKQLKNSYINLKKGSNNTATIESGELFFSAINILDEYIESKDKHRNLMIGFFLSTLKYETEKTLLSGEKKEIKLLNGDVKQITSKFSILTSLVLSLPQGSFILANPSENKPVEFNDNTNNEYKFIKLIIKNEIEDIYSSDKRLSMDIGKEYPFHSATEIQKTYEKNEIKGDLNFKDKIFYITGNVASIDSSFQDQPAIHFETDSDNQFQNPIAFFKDYESKIEKIAEIEKGDKLILLCTGAGENIGSPLLSDCTFFDDQIDDMIKNQKAIDSINLNGGYTSDNLYLSIRVLSSILPDTSACFNENINACEDELLRLPSNKIRQAANRYHLSRDKIISALKAELDMRNKEIIQAHGDTDDVRKLIEFKERCYAPILISLF